MIVVTGAAGFIGSCLIRKLNDKGFDGIIAVDDFTRADKSGNLDKATIASRIQRDDFSAWMDTNGEKVNYIYHIGARTDTTEFNEEVFNKLNLEYSKMVWKHCVDKGIPLVYASSAATYGEGELGYSDSHELIPRLKPLNPYGESKNEFDKWVLLQDNHPPFWAGLKFFNVFGPNEYHKKRMASVIFHAYHQIRETGKVKLFRSHRSDYKDGWQLRDFVYVKDVVEVCMFFYYNRNHSGIYNLGSGQARSFHDLATAVFNAMQKPVDIEYIDIPADIREKYQYFTEAGMDKLKAAGYSKPFFTLEEAVKDYVVNYLQPNRYF